ncbi:MAG TPA: DUF4956 domain-containing protein [Candidatus Aminicenantes bacterium]|nr:DUF4956 domain-containing protein [Candidatus Aminicenantes bacterium]
METNIKEWISAIGNLSNQKLSDIGFFPFLFVMLLSLASSFFISYLYARFYKTRATGSEVHRSFVLLGISVTAIFICIQFSLPLSLGLLGALSIVRFRTPIKEPEEIGFIMLVIASSISIATFNLLFLGIFLLVTVAALLIQRASGGMLMRGKNDGMIIVTLAAEDYYRVSADLVDLLEKRLPKGRFDSISENADESVMAYSFIQREKNALIDIQRELRSLVPGIRSNLFFNRSGDV